MYTCGCTPWLSLQFITLERLSFFSRVMETLRQAGDSEYEALQIKCLQLEEEITSQYPIPPFKDVTELLHLPQDNFSKSLMPRDLQNMIPLRCQGDGNCLYR